MSAPVRILKTIALAAAAALAIMAVGQGLWGALVYANLATIPALPWAPVVMAGVLALLIGVLGGRIGPKAGRRRAPRAAAPWPGAGPDLGLVVDRRRQRHRRTRRPLDHAGRARAGTTEPADRRRRLSPPDHGRLPADGDPRRAAH